MAFWKTTVHARAWKTIVDGGKTGFDDCVSCHVTGFGEVGGSSLGHVKGLTDVQCETCHGPGSLHVKAEGLEEPPAVRLNDAGVDLRALPQRETLRHLRVRRLPARHPGPGPRGQGARRAGPRAHRAGTALGGQGSKARAKAAAKVALSDGALARRRKDAR